MNEYDKFLKWSEDNNIELYPYQKEFIKAFFNNQYVILPRQNGRSYGIELLGDFYKNKAR